MKQFIRIKLMQEVTKAKNVNDLSKKDNRYFEIKKNKQKIEDKIEFLKKIGKVL